jgi:DNA polymerase I
VEKVTLLIDGDVVAYRATAAVEQEIQWDDDLFTLHSEPEEAKGIVLEQINGWLKRFDAGNVVVAFSDSHNFRKDIYPLYKANRKEKRKPVAYKGVKEWMCNQWISYIRPGLEGDDILGILSTHPTLIRGQKIIVSVDKDFHTIPGYFWNPEKMTEPVYTHPSEADYSHMYQTLTGDATDGYPGLPGCGPVKAEKLLTDTAPENWWKAVVEAYEKKGLTEEDALVQARCARILRHTDYDFKKKEVKLWLPT